MTTVMDFLPEFFAKLSAQLISDDKRWGNEWLKRPREGQIRRIIERLTEYEEEAMHGKPFPWLKMAGLAMIGYIRDAHTKEWPNPVPLARSVQVPAPEPEERFVSDVGTEELNVEQPTQAR